MFEDDPVAPEPTPREVARTTGEAINAAAAQPPVAIEPAATATPDSVNNGSVFMLGKPRRKPTVAEVLGIEPAAEAAPAAALPAPAPTLAKAPTASPAAAPAPAAAAEALVPVEAAAPAGPVPLRADGGSNGNVFLLNKPKAARPAATTEAPVAAAPAEPPAPAPAPPAPVTDAESGDEPADANIFMLNRPKHGSAPGDGAAASPAVAVVEPK
jgi:hypothetical protein